MQVSSNYKTSHERVLLPHSETNPSGWKSVSNYLTGLNVFITNEVHLECHWRFYYWPAILSQGTSVLVGQIVFHVRAAVYTLCPLGKYLMH